MAGAARRGEICGNEAHLHHIPMGRVVRTVLGGQNHQPVEEAPVNAFLALFRPFRASFLRIYSIFEKSAKSCDIAPILKFYNPT